MNANEHTVHNTLAEQQLQSVAQTEEPEVPTFRRMIGGTTYIVGVHFSQTSKETLADKVKRLMVEEVQNAPEQCKC